MIIHIVACAIPRSGMCDAHTLVRTSAEVATSKKLFIRSLKKWNINFEHSFFAWKINWNFERLFWLLGFSSEQVSNQFAWNYNFNAKNAVSSVLIEVRNTDSAEKTQNIEIYSKIYTKWDEKNINFEEICCSLARSKNRALEILKKISSKKTSSWIFIIIHRPSGLITYYIFTIL